MSFWPSEVRFSLWNHDPGGRPTCFDIVNAMACQLYDLGIKSTRDDSCNPNAYGNSDCVTELVSPPGVNIMTEAFDPAKIREMKRMREQGCRMILVLTEAPGKRGFNDTHGQVSDGLKIRQDCAPYACEMADGVICLIKDTVPWAKMYNDKVVFAELGYSLVREALIRTDVVPDADFVFFGGRGERRQNILNLFSAKGFKVITPPSMYGDIIERNRTIARAKCSLGIRAQSKWHITSSSRYSTSLHGGRPVAAEFHKIETPWREVIDMAKTIKVEEFMDLAVDVMRNYEAAYERQMTAFRERMSPERCIGAALEAIYGPRPEGAFNA